MTSPPPASVNLNLLIKLLKLTASPHDGEALAAIRAANLQLSKVTSDWETLLRGRVTIIADPWPQEAPPPPSNGWRPPTRPAAAPPQAAQQQRPTPKASPPKPQPRPRQRTNWRAVPPASASDL